MMRTRTRVLMAMALLCTSAFAASATAAVHIKYRSYSGSATMGPQAQAYADKVKEITAAALGEDDQVIFESLGTAAIPSQFGNILAAVEAGAAHEGFDAAYISGGDLNKAWGFIYNSGVPFGPTFDEFAGFLLGKAVDGKQTGVELMQSILAKSGKNVVAFPIVAGSEQSSGFFPEPVGPARGRLGIGLVGLCQRPWTFRYLPPAENILGLACDDLVSAGLIRAKKIKFLAAVPGNGSLIGAVKDGTIQAFEFATPLDDKSQLFATADNPGTVGVPFMHEPGWHQQFQITYMIINKQVWEGLTPGQQALVQSLGRDHLISAYAESLRQQGDALRFILGANGGDGDGQNDIVLVRWPKPALERLRNATIKYLNARASDGSLSATDREDYGVVLEALRRYVRSNDLYWREREVSPSMRFERWTNEDGEGWR
jgi:TRAP-type mannitol/chloroaromatic compound transport system substrate-binding protein